ncbi:MULTISPECIES: bifunctional nicotinamidase/pyrazinamidase [unclassified Rhizobium]|uniref:bifunctional nicotinamidase/pyrazinamidase n=1 Tax=unclassified Rhizobium TaxID=2613769 RepID=UPI0006F5DAC9|nr:MULTISPECIES: bifunctional nicotinamidase/pyrazinamidase [unclassified Rhizobium]KQV38573.1 nicotinamidase [Rhizobium sp. Root1212]KRD31231.1 nicotinamidase [Rhizobium sp. Root268]
MKCLLLVDIQNGFCSGGNLAVPEGEAVVAVANRLIAEGGYDLIVASQDWHPADHGSFASQHPGKAPFELGSLGGKPQMMWPDHCVQGTGDAEFHPDLNTAAFDYVQRKGMNVAVDSYSAFRDNDHAALTGLADFLKEHQVNRLDIVGLATDYCVKFSALDAKEMLPGVTVRVIEDACRGITPDGVKQALDEMTKAGIHVVSSDELLAAA